MSCLEKKKKKKNFHPFSQVQGADESKNHYFVIKLNKKVKMLKDFFLRVKVFHLIQDQILENRFWDGVTYTYGGAANRIGLKKLVDDFNLNVDLRLLICLVENSISKKSIRPSDIIKKSREGSFVEIGDTDAEGRLILADGISYACEKKADLIIDMATLTGASRVAMGIEVPSF